MNVSGFTLIEVMMALFIISVGLVALVYSSQYSVQTLETAKSKTAAYHVADQVLLSMYQSHDLQLGQHQGETEFQGQTFYWQATLENTENTHVNRINVIVSLNRKFDYSEARLTGFKKS